MFEFAEMRRQRSILSSRGKRDSECFHSPKHHSLSKVKKTSQKSSKAQEQLFTMKRGSEISLQIDDTKALKQPQIMIESQIRLIQAKIEKLIDQRGECLKLLTSGPKNLFNQFWNQHQKISLSIRLLEQQKLEKQQELKDLLDEQSQICLIQARIDMASIKPPEHNTVNDEPKIESSRSTEQRSQASQRPASIKSPGRNSLSIQLFSGYSSVLSSPPKIDLTKAQQPIKQVKSSRYQEQLFPIHHLSEISQQRLEEKTQKQEITKHDQQKQYIQNRIKQSREDLLFMRQNVLKFPLNTNIADYYLQQLKRLSSLEQQLQEQLRQLIRGKTSIKPPERKAYSIQFQNPVNRQTSYRLKHGTTKTNKSKISCPPKRDPKKVQQPMKQVKPSRYYEQLFPMKRGSEIDLCTSAENRAIQIKSRLLKIQAKIEELKEQDQQIFKLLIKNNSSDYLIKKGYMILKELEQLRKERLEKQQELKEVMEEIKRGRT